jgi:hypothetical protein
MTWGKAKDLKSQEESIFESLEEDSKVKQEFCAMGDSWNFESGRN